MIYPSYELSQEIQQARLAEAEQERLSRSLSGGRFSLLPTKLLLGVGDLLVSSGLKLKRVALSGVAS